MNTIIYLNVPGHRLRVRRLNEQKLAAQVSQEAQASGHWIAQVFHGGSVAYAYKHPAMTEAALIVSNPLGETVVWMAKLAASRVTLGGAANKCLLGTRAIWDGRYSDETKAKARRLLQDQHRVHFHQTVYTKLMQDLF